MRNTKPAWASLVILLGALAILALMLSGSSISNGGGGSGSGTAPLFTSTASATVTNSGTSLVGTGVGSTTLPANYFAAGTILHVFISGVYSSAGTPGSLSLAVTLGGVNVMGAGAIVPVASANNAAWSMDTYLICRTAGAMGTIGGQGLAFFTNSTNSTTLTAPLGNNATTFDTTGTLAVNITASWGSFAAGDTITGVNILLEGAAGAPVSSVFGQTGAVNIPVTTTDISTPAPPASGQTRFYTKAGKLCAENPSSVETCTGAGGGSTTTPFIQTFSSIATTVTPHLNVTSGNEVMIGVCSDTTPTSVTDGTNTWAKIASQAGTGIITVWSTTAASSAGITITLNGGTFGTDCEAIFGMELAAGAFKSLDTSAGAAANHVGLTTGNASELMLTFESSTSNGVAFVPRAPLIAGGYANGDGGIALGWFLTGAAVAYDNAIDSSGNNPIILALAMH